MGSLTLQELFDVAVNCAAILFNETHEVLPMMHAVRKDGSHAIIPLLWDDQADKARVLQQLKRAMSAFGIQQYAIIAEAWMVDVRRPSDLAGYETLKDHPDRREALTISAADNQGNRIAGLYYILRPEHGPPKLSPLQTPYDCCESEFLDLLEA